MQCKCLLKCGVWLNDAWAVVQGRKVFYLFAVNQRVCVVKIITEILKYRDWSQLYQG